MAPRPGELAFLFTDIEGSTRRWEAEPETMAAALARHDDVLRHAVSSAGGVVFKHTGDGICAVFATATSAVGAAVGAQRALELPVRMGISVGEARERDGDYFGPVLNRAARVMSAGHGGQVLMDAPATVSLSEIELIELIELGEHRLRDLSRPTLLFQVRAEGLASHFPPLRTVDAVPGNLPVVVSSLVGRKEQVEQLIALVRSHRLVTLIGVGGVGKTRLAVHVAGELTAEFTGGVWLVELAQVSDAAAVADVVATALNVSLTEGRTVIESVCLALSARRLLVVLDNCEHVVDAAAELVEAILARAPSVSILATSREALGVTAERAWTVPPLDVAGGATSAAAELFVERARAQGTAFLVADDEDAAAVADICRRLDGLALAIELAAARMSSMTLLELRDRLDDRFRLLHGTRRGPARHQTLRNMVEWSYGLLTPDEQVALNRCAVFSDGFDLAAFGRVCSVEPADHVALDLLDSLVRKSLLTFERVDRHGRYGMLETVRQFGESQLVAADELRASRDRHAAYFAEQAVAQWDRWDGPGQRHAVDWVETEFANLRTAYRWAAEGGQVDIAAAVAAHTTLLAWAVQRFEPAGWAEDLLATARDARIPQLPRLYVAASLCMFTGRPDVGLAHAQAAVAMDAEAGRDPFAPGWSRSWEASAHLYTGDLDRALEIYAELCDQGGLAHVAGLGGLLYALPAAGRTKEAIAIADAAVRAARDHGNPFWVAWALTGGGQAFADADPDRALEYLHDGLQHARDHHLPLWEARIAREAAGLEALYGDVDEGMSLFDTALEAFHHAGDHANAAVTLAHLAIVLAEAGRPEVAATLYGAAMQHPSSRRVTRASAMAEDLRVRLGERAFERCVATGHELSPSEAVDYARDEIERVSGPGRARRDRLRRDRQARPDLRTQPRCSSS